MGQHKFEVYMSYNEECFRTLSTKFDFYAVELDRVKSLTNEHRSFVTKLKANKVDQSHFATLQSEVKALKVSNSELCSELEDLKADKADQFQTHDYRINNNKLDIKRVHKSNQHLSEG